MTEKVEKIEPATTGIIKNEKGQWVKGQSGNPEGRPKGTVSIVSALKERLEEIPKGEKKTYLNLFIDQIVKKTLKDGDVSMMKDVIDRIDGKPRQDVNIDMKGTMALQTVEDKLKNLLHGQGSNNNSGASQEPLQNGRGEGTNVDGVTMQDLSTDSSEEESEDMALRSHEIRKIIDGSSGSSD